MSTQSLCASAFKWDGECNIWIVSASLSIYLSLIQFNFIHSLCFIGMNLKKKQYCLGIQQCNSTNNQHFYTMNSLPCISLCICVCVCVSYFSAVEDLACWVFRSLTLTLHVSITVALCLQLVLVCGGGKINNYEKCIKEHRQNHTDEWTIYYECARLHILVVDYSGVAMTDKSIILCSVFITIVYVQFKTFSLVCSLISFHLELWKAGISFIYLFTFLFIH